MTTTTKTTLTLYDVIRCDFGSEPGRIAWHFSFELKGALKAAHEHDFDHVLDCMNRIYGANSLLIVMGKPCFCYQELFRIQDWLLKISHASKP